MSESIVDRQEKIRAKFASFSDPDDKWKFLLDLAREHKGMDASLKDPKYKVLGCAAVMYLVPFLDGNLLHFEMDVDGGVTNPLISRGLGVLALMIFNDLTPQEILSIDSSFFQEIGLNVGLTPSRSNGFASLLRDIKLYAKIALVGGEVCKSLIKERKEKNV